MENYKDQRNEKWGWKGYIKREKNEKWSSLIIDRCLQDIKINRDRGMTSEN